MSDVLQEVSVPRVWDTCDDMHDGVPTHNMLCAGNHFGGKDFCQVRQKLLLLSKLETQ